MDREVFDEARAAAATVHRAFSEIVLALDYAVPESRDIRSRIQAGKRPAELRQQKAWRELDGFEALFNGLIRTIKKSRRPDHDAIHHLRAASEIVMEELEELERVATMPVGSAHGDGGRDAA